MKATGKVGKPAKKKCVVCAGTALAPVYRGPIRSAGVGSAWVDGFTVLRCAGCGVAFLDPFPRHCADFYESDVYRREYDNTVDAAALTAKYDWEQNDRVQAIGLETLRGKTVADFGCGIGLFLDAVKGVAGRTIAVEPMQSFKPVLLRKGHEYRMYPDRIAAGSVDVAVCFDVLEHIEKPLPFLKSIRTALKPGGMLYIAVPNSNDILTHVCGDAAKKFLFCTAHVLYFDRDALSGALAKSGFRVLHAGGMHKYDFYNLVNWLKQGKPCGRKESPFVDRYFETAFKNELIRLGLGSHVFIHATKV